MTTPLASWGAVDSSVARDGARRVMASTRARACRVVWLTGAQGGALVYLMTSGLRRCTFDTVSFCRRQPDRGLKPCRGGYRRCTTISLPV